MQRISDAVKDLVEGNALLRFGMRERLLNLSQVARYLQPLIAARTKKDVQTSALVMGLSRMQRDLADPECGDNRGPQGFRIKNIIVHSDLAILTFPKTKEVHRALQAIYTKVLDKGGFITITEGTNQITLIIEEVNRALVSKHIEGAPLHIEERVSSLGLKFDESYLHLPGLFHFIFQQLYFQNINVIEIASTATELIVYLSHDDLRLAFDSIYQRFVVQAYEV